jgi:hypothetical protein
MVLTILAEVSFRHMACQVFGLSFPPLLYTAVIEYSPVFKVTVVLIPQTLD